MTQLIFTDEVLRRAEAVLAREPALRDTMASAETLAEIRTRGASSAEYFALACERYAERTSLASALGTITYGKLWERAARIASTLSRGEHVGICGAPGIDWVVADLACLIAGAISVPLAVNLATDELRALVEHAELARMICSAARVDAIAEVMPHGRIISMQNDLADTHAHPAVQTLAELEAAGVAQAPIRASDDDLVTIMYSSGTTGRPKGVMLGERRWRAHLENALGWPPFPHLWVGYLPHSQIAGRRLVLEPMMHGGITHFATAALPLDDIARVRPTIVPLLPRVSGILFQEYQAALLAKHDPDQVAADLRARYRTDRLCTIRVGSGSTPPAVLEFLARCFDVPVADGYGTTESGALAINGVLFDHVDYKIAPVEELGYTYPRGELLVRSRENTPGYYKDPEATAALYDGDFFKTGDIVEEIAPRRLAWLDRRTSVTKLAQGQFIATSQLEQLYASQSPLIDQIYLYANPRHAFLLAVVVPNGDVGRDVIRQELDRIAREAHRPAHEVPRDFLVEPAPFTVANELMTESGKQNLRRLRERYGAALDALHAEIEARQLSTEALTDPTKDLASRFRAAVAITLGVRVEDVIAAPPDLGFVSFGGDSLAALRLCKLVEESLGVPLSAARVLDPRASIATLIEEISNRASIAFEDVHAGPIAREDELARLAADLGRGPVDIGRHAAVDLGARGAVLLTGATGFLGRMLALELADRTPVICMVRAPDDAAALVRVRDAMTGAGLTERIDALVADGRITAIAGDLMRPDLGLTTSARGALVERIDAIIHAGALVNHALPYRHLFGPNVLGTRELARLALARPGIGFCFLSSIGVPLQATRAVDSVEPGAGYATSKWACEVLLDEMHRRYELPVALVRCGNIAPHRAHPSALNWADNTNRLLASIVETGLAPESFYAGSGGRYDLVPLDAVVPAIATIATSMSAAAGAPIFHVTSDDEVSLDSLVAWVASAGVELRRLPYDTWFAAWSERLAALPAERRARSAFATLDRWRSPTAVGGTRLDTTSYRALRTSIVDEPLVHRWVAALRAH